MNRSRDYYRKQRSKKIRKRSRLISDLSNRTIQEDIVLGKLTDGSFGFLSCGTSKKTNSRKGHASYRHKGTYANQHKKHDAIRIDDMNYQLKEYDKGEKYEMNKGDTEF